MRASAARHGRPLFAAGLCAVLVLAACRSGVPVIDANPGTSHPSQHARPKPEVS